MSGAEGSKPALMRRGFPSSRRAFRSDFSMTSTALRQRTSMSFMRYPFYGLLILRNPFGTERDLPCGEIDLQDLRLNFRARGIGRFQRLRRSQVRFGDME